MMLLKVKRHWFSDKSTIGVIEVDGVKCGFTLEDTARPDGVKISGVTAIPHGEYEVTIDYSQRFMKPMPHILNVPGFEGIRIHKGNLPSQTEGCILVGLRKGQDLVYDCDSIFKYIFDKIETSMNNNDRVSILIINEQI